MTTYSELGREYAARQTGFQAALEKVREQTGYVRRLHAERPGSDEYQEAAKVLAEMTQQTTDLREARDRVWRQLKEYRHEHR